MNRNGPLPPRPGYRRVAAALIGACAAYQVGIGAYFVAFRPQLLPEDLRFLGATAERLAVILPRLEGWLDLVFAVLGGQMAALGVLLAGLAVRLVRSRSLSGYELVFLSLAGLLSVASMSVVNFALGSDFRWLLTIPVAAWAAGVVFAAFGTKAARTRTAEGLHDQ